MVASRREQVVRRKHHKARMGSLKQFSLDEANALVPWLERTMEDLRQRLRAIETLATVLKAHEPPGAAPAVKARRGDSHEVTRLKIELRREIVAIRECTESVELLGAVVKDVEHGTVDFPSSLEGVPVWLCWRHGERSVRHWHPMDDCVAQRQLLESVARMH